MFVSVNNDPILAFEFQILKVLGLDHFCGSPWDSISKLPISVEDFHTRAASSGSLNDIKVSHNTNNCKIAKLILLLNQIFDFIEQF